MDPSLEQLDRYRVIEEVGRGGMAVVYRGRDRSLDREVAIKVLHAHLADAPESRARFQREARAVAKLKHRSIIEIYDYADADEGEGPSYIVTEFIQGQTLKAFMAAHGVFFPEVAVLIGLEICEAIGHAHSFSIIHRDLKPENIMIDPTGQLKLMDFGIAKVIDQQQQMTIPGAILGSPAHMAPEILEGKKLDIRSDIFSIGTILYWLATGILPFAGKNPHHVLRRILDGDFTNPQQVNPEIGAELTRIIKRCLANRPEERPASAKELTELLRATLADLDVEDPLADLRRFLQQPAAYLEALRPRVAKSLLERGRFQLKNKNHRKALEALDRLLAMEPGHPEALSLIGGLERRKRWLGRLSIGATSLALLLLAGAVAWAVVHFWPRDVDALEDPLDAGLAAIGTPGGIQSLDEPERARDAGETSVEEQRTAPDLDARANAEPAASDAGRALPDRQRRVASRLPSIRQGDPRSSRPRVRAIEEAKPVEHEVKIKCRPWCDELHIDGQLVAKIGDRGFPGVVYRGMLAAGEHHLILKNKRCFDLHKTIVVPEHPRRDEDLEHACSFEKYKPAQLLFDGLPDAVIRIDGEDIGTARPHANMPFDVPAKIKPMGAVTSWRVQLRVYHEEVGELVKPIELKPGMRTKIELSENGIEVVPPRDTASGDDP